MSMITAMGSKPAWSPKDDSKKELVKTASTKVSDGTISDDSPLYLAAKAFFAKKAMDEIGGESCPTCGKTPCECADGKCDGLNTEDVAKTEVPEEVEIEITDDAPVATSVSESVKAIEESAEKAEQVIEEVESAINEIENAVNNVKDVVNKGKGGEAKDIGEKSDVPDFGKKDDSDEKSEDIVVESEPEDKKEVDACTAASKDQYVRLGHLSKENKGKVKSYWTALGFPKDYVDLMVKDHE